MVFTLWCANGYPLDTIQQALFKFSLSLLILSMIMINDILWTHGGHDPDDPDNPDDTDDPNDPDDPNDALGPLWTTLGPL